ncbi:hypothetical protein LSCM1_01083 [Leishmania martiniquensis]|uniref:Uncharacterized protein n=1 Tax=Leishmania martiniquensis TaxID=1580590 RepID=A0A836G2Y5_9TRYP|nr:hypothetical protein LSCM1_01083 [Leishmania martiniquensis]
MAMSNSSSDDDAWMPQSRPPGLSAGSGQSAMLEARRRALQQQREAQQQERQRQPQESGRQAPTAASSGAGPQAESSLPDILGGSEEDVTQRAPVTFSSNDYLPLPPQRPPAAVPAAVSSHEVTVEQLKREIAVKQKLLQSTRERETSLMERWRAAKAQKQAEIEQLNVKLRRVCAAIEDEKSACETKMRESQDAHEAELQAARRDVERAVKSEYDVKIAEATQQLQAAREEEAHLRAMLDKSGDGDGAAVAAKDVVKTALVAAVSAVLRRLGDVFESEEAEGLRMNAWRSELESLVQHEIQTSFAVGVESEAQAERVEYARVFDDMLAFWRTAEDQQRERLLKMDESLLTDVQAMAQQELKLLQDEALGMERVYIESREAWAVEHQRLLQRELEATLQRREVELQEQRRQRHSLHLERLRDAEARHKDVMAREEAMHQRQMEQLQAYFGREEDLRAEQQRVQSAALEDVTKSTALLRDIMAIVEDAAAAVKAYEVAVDESRRRVEVEREEHFKEEQEMLTRLLQLAATQRSNTDAERTALEDCASQLRLASQNLQRHLQDESAWLVQQETTHQRSKDEWEREYRRWQYLVQQERQTAEERFHEALLALQQSISLLDAEEREVAVEATAMHRSFGDMEALAQKEMEALRRRAADVQSRSAAIAEVQTRLSMKKAAVTEAKKQLDDAKQRLEEEQAELRFDEERLRDTLEALRVARSQAALRSYHTELLRAADAQTPRQPAEAAVTTDIDSSRYPPNHVEGKRLARDQEPHGGAKANISALREAASLKKRKHHRDSLRLPSRVLQELQEQLNALSTSSGSRQNAFVSTMPWADPAPFRASVMRRMRQAHPKPRKAFADALAASVPAPLSAPPFAGRQPPNRRKERTWARPELAAAKEGHADPSSLPLTADSLSQLSLRSDDEWTPSSNTFTKLIGFSDLDTSQSVR